MENLNAEEEQVPLITIKLMISSRRRRASRCGLSLARGREVLSEKEAILVSLFASYKFVSIHQHLMS